MSDLSKTEIEQWTKWYNKYVLPLFDANHRNAYFKMLKSMQPPFYPNEQVASKFHEQIEDDSRFESELKYFFAFIAACGFFERYNLTFEEWINSPCWFNPKSINERNETILELNGTSAGVQKLKLKLRWLPFLERPDGN